MIEMGDGNTMNTESKGIKAFKPDFESLKAPDNRISVIKSLTDKDKVVSVRLLGGGDPGSGHPENGNPAGGNLEFTQNWGTLVIKLPRELPTKYANCLAIELEGSEC